MRSSILVLALVAGASSLGCAFTQWTDRYFLGTAGGSPVYADRTAAGLVLVPFAFVADLVTFPAQAVILVCGGDQILYSQAQPKDLALRLDPRARVELAALHDGMAPTDTPVLVGVDAAGEVHALHATPAQVKAVTRRMKGGAEEAIAGNL